MLDIVEECYASTPSKARIQITKIKMKEERLVLVSDWCESQGYHHHGHL